MSIGNWVRCWKRSHTPKTIRNRRLGMETLEDRATPATFSQSGGLLTISMTGATDALTISGLIAGGTSIGMNGTGISNQSATGVTAITINNTSGVAGTQAVRFQDTSGRITLSGALTINSVHTVDFNNPVLPLTANGGITITGGRFITQQLSSIQQLVGGGTVTLSAAGTGDAIGSASNPIRIAGNSASLSSITSAGNGNQYFDLGGGFVNVNGGQAGDINAGTGTVTLTNGQFAGAAGIEFGDTTTFNLGTGGALSIANTETIGGLTGTGIVGANGAGTRTLVVGGGNLSSTFSGTIQNVAPINVGAGAISLTKTGNGTFTLNGANTFTGGTTVNGGMLRVIGTGAANRLANNSLVTVNSAGIFEIGDTNPIPTVANSVDVTLNGGILQLSGASNSGDHIRNLTFNNGGTVRNSGSISSFSNTNLAVNGTITVTGSSSTPASFDLPNGIAIANTTFSVADITGNANPDLVFSATTGIREVGSTASLTKTGAGTLVLAAANTYSGGTTISGGTLSVSTIADSGASNLGTAGDLTFRNGATLLYTGTGANTTARTVTTSLGSGVINVSSPTGSLNLSGSTNGQFPDTSSFTLTKAGPGTLQLTGTVDNPSLVLNAQAGKTILAKTNSGNVHALAGISDIASGATVELGGTGGDQIFNGGFSTRFGLVRMSGGTLDLKGLSESFDILNGSGVVTNGAAGSPILSLGTAVGNSPSGNALLVNVTVANGAAATDVTTSASGAIGGFGTIQGATVVTSGGALLPGDENTVGTLNTGNITFNAGSFFGVKMTGFQVSDRLNVTGTVNLGGATLFAVETPAALATHFIITNDGNDPIVGTFAGLPEGATFRGDNGKPFLISYVGGDGNDVTLTPDTLPTRLLATGPGTGSGLLFSVTSGQYGNPQNVSLIPGFTGEIRVARVDVNGDGAADLVAGSGPGGSRIRIISGTDNSTVIADFNAFPGFGGGVYVAGGDFNGDGFEELVVTGDGADAFSGPVANGLGVRIYSGATLTGSNPPVLASFNGLASLSGAQGEGAAVRLGGRPAVADVNGDARPDLLISAGNGGGPRVVIWPAQAFFTASSGQPPVNPIANLFVFESTQRGGAFLTAGDLNGDGFADIAVGGGPGGGPRVRTVNSFLMLGLPNLEAVNLDDPTNLANGLVLNNFFAGDGNSRGGVRVAMRDADLDGFGDLVTASGTNEQSQIRIYSDVSVNAAFGSSNEPSSPQVIDPFSALLPGGVWIG